MRRPAGYTFLELLVVLAIIVILVGLVTAGVATYLDRTRGRSMQVEKETVFHAIGVYNVTDVDASDPTPIDASPGVDAMHIDPAAADSPPFAKYLDKVTKYYYTWEDEGENLIVYERADKTGRSY